MKKVASKLALAILLVIAALLVTRLFGLWPEAWIQAELVIKAGL